MRLRPETGIAHPGPRNSPAAAFRRLLIPLLPALHALAPAMHFPDTVELKKTFRVQERKAGLPAELTRPDGADTLRLRLEWRDGRLVSALYRRPAPFLGEEFQSLVSRHARGANWHEVMDSAQIARLRARYPGLEQQWILAGWEQQGWLGSGLFGGEFFLVFRDRPPEAIAEVNEPLALDPGLRGFLDTSSLWLRDGECGGAGGESCYVSVQERGFRLRIEGEAPTRVRLEREGIEPLPGVREAFSSVPGEKHAEYAADISGILFMEGHMFLVEVAQRFPEFFNWPSWRLQSLQEGRVPPARYLEMLRRRGPPPATLPALEFQGSAVELTVLLDLAGGLVLTARQPGR